jgi:hypothetical protein
VIAPLIFEAWIAGLFAVLRPLEKLLEGTIQAQDDILQDLRVDGLVLRSDFLDAGQFGFPFGVAKAHPSHLPGVAPFLQGGIVHLRHRVRVQNNWRSGSGVGSRLYSKALWPVGTRYGSGSCWFAFVSGALCCTRCNS